MTYKIGCTYFIKELIDILCSFGRCFKKNQAIFLGILLTFLQYQTEKSSHLQNDLRIYKNIVSDSVMNLTGVPFIVLVWIKNDQKGTWDGEEWIPQTPLFSSLPSQPCYRPRTLLELDWLRSNKDLNKFTLAWNNIEIHMNQKTLIRLQNFSRSTKTFTHLVFAILEPTF